MNAKKFGLFIKPKEEQKPKLKTFVDDLKDDDDEDYLNESDDDSHTNKNNKNKNNQQNFKNNINKNILKQQQYNSLKLSEEIGKNILIDPNVYEYDSLYDEVSTNSKSKIKKNTNNNMETEKPKYINAIMANSEKRKIEQSIIQENVERSRREREKGEYGDKPKFITRAYEEKLNLNKKNEVNLTMNDKYDEKNTINSENGMMGFYSNLMTKNVAYSTQNQNQKQEKNIEDSDKKIIQEKDKKIDLYKNKNTNKNELLQNKLNKTETKIILNEEKIISTNKKTDENIQVKKIEQIIEDKSASINIEDYKLRYLARKRERIETSNEN